MKKNHYPGYINLEYEGDLYPPEEAIKKGTLYLRELIAQS